MIFDWDWWFWVFVIVCEMIVCRCLCVFWLLDCVGDWIVVDLGWWLNLESFVVIDVRFFWDWWDLELVFFFFERECLYNVLVKSYMISLWCFCLFYYLRIRLWMWVGFWICYLGCRLFRILLLVVLVICFLYWEIVVLGYDWIDWYVLIGWMLGCLLFCWDEEVDWKVVYLIFCDVERESEVLKWLCLFE